MRCVQYVWVYELWGACCLYHIIVCFSCEVYHFGDECIAALSFCLFIYG